MAELAKKIVEEINDKLKDYESNMGKFLDQIGEFGDLFRVRRPKRNQREGNHYSNPRLTEFFRAANTLGTMMYRMQTAQDPFFEAVPLSPLQGDDQLLKIQATMETQIQESKYRKNLLKADMGVAAFGTQIIQEDYEIIGLNPFGRRIPVTTFVPRSFLQIGFDRSCLDLDDSDWISTSDLISDAGLMKLARESKELGIPWNQKVLEFAAKEEINNDDISQHLLNRLNQLGYVSGEGKLNRKELVFYYGKLECLNDGLEYVCGLVSRKHLARFHPNKNQSGKRNFRIATWVEDPLCIDPLGIGIGHIAGNLHKALDANRQRYTDGFTMMTYNMWAKIRGAGIDDNDLKLRPNQIVEMDERDGITPLQIGTEGPTAGLKLEELLRQEFQAATGATSTLQAQVTEATASEVSLAQNEGVRNVSVKAELVAESFVREHLMITHINNVENMRKPFNINRSGFAGTVYPSDFKVDIDFRIKIVSDKDFRPKRLEQIIQMIQILSSTKNDHADTMQISIIPLVQEAARALGIPAKDLIYSLQSGPINIPSAPGAMPNIAGMAGPEQISETPVGPVLSSPNP